MIYSKSKLIARKQVFLRVRTVKSDVTLATGAVICVIFTLDGYTFVAIYFINVSFNAPMNICTKLAIAILKIQYTTQSCIMYCNWIKYSYTA